MTRILIALVMLLISFCACAQPIVNLNLFLGVKQLNQKDLISSSEEQGELGFMIDYSRPGWPVTIAVDFLVASENTNYLGGDREYQSSSRELDLGLRKYIDMGGSLYPYIGGGIARTTIEYSTRYIFTHSTDGSGVGYWLGAGVVWRLENLNIGLDFRRSEVDVEFGDAPPSDAGGNHVGLIIGIHM